jgi:soluble lytic murein transglycosylase-like protein
MMTKVLPVALFMALAAVPALAQNGYSFDNFDARTGVKVYVAPKAAPAPANKSKLRSRRKDSARPGAAASGAPTVGPQTGKTSAAGLGSEPTRPLLRQTSLAYPETNPIGGAPLTALRGYTTGSAEIDGYVVQSGTRNGVDPLLLYSIMHQESSFKLHAVSPKGARGLMQLMPFTAMRWGVTNIFDPRQNIEGGARYMRFLLDRFDNDVTLALAGYNAGEGAVEKYGWQVPPYSETQEYVRRIGRRYALLRDPNSALYATRMSGTQIAAMRNRTPEPLTVYERSVFTVQLPDGRLQLVSQ